MRLLVYHIHALPVPADGNCTSTLGHLDPTDRGEYFPCDVSAPATCQAGDLAGKHGNVTGPGVFTVTYNEPYLSTDPSSPYFFGDKSFVIHTSNTTRLTCASFAMVGGNSSSSSSSSSSMSSMTGTPTVAPGSGGASMSSMGSSASATASGPSSVATAGAGTVAITLPGALLAWVAAGLMLA
jgi:hypothetical protein